MQLQGGIYLKEQNKQYFNKHYKHQHIIMLQRVRIEDIQINIWHPDIINKWHNDMNNVNITNNAKTIAQ